MQQCRLRAGAQHYALQNIFPRARIKTSGGKFTECKGVPYYNLSLSSSPSAPSRPFLLYTPAALPPRGPFIVMALILALLVVDVSVPVPSR